MRYYVTESINLPPLVVGDFPQTLTFHTDLLFHDSSSSTYTFSFELIDEAGDIYLKKSLTESVEDGVSFVEDELTGTTITVSFVESDLFDADVYDWRMDYRSESKKITLGFGKIQINSVP